MSAIDNDLFGDEVVVNTEEGRKQEGIIEDETLNQEGEAADDLFGDASLQDSDVDDVDQDDTVEVRTRFEVANFKQPRGDNDEIFLAKLPSFLDVDPYAFDPETLLAEIQQSADSTADNDEKMVKKRSLVNTLRWRSTAKTSMVEERVSNARFVKWNDGTMSLQIGEELFDVPIKNVEKDHSYLTMMHADEGLLRSMQRFVYSMSFQPYGLSSKSHAELKADIARRAISSKGRTVKLHTEMIDPAEIQKQAIRADNEKQKARRRLDNQKSKSLNHMSSGRDRTQLTARYLDDSDEELELTRRQRYADENDDGFIEDDELSDLEDDDGGDRLQALKAAGAAVYQDRQSKRARSESDSDQSDIETIAHHESTYLGAGSEAEAGPSESLDNNEAPRVKKLKRRIADSEEEEEE